jgi:hypothetical protein
MSTQAVPRPISKPHIFALPGKPLTIGTPRGFKSTVPDELAAAAPAAAQFDYPATYVGSTAHFAVYYNPNLGAAGSHWPRVYWAESRTITTPFPRCSAESKQGRSM